MNLIPREIGRRVAGLALLLCAATAPAMAQNAPKSGLALPGETHAIKGSTFKMVRIPAQRFTRGSPLTDKDRFSSEMPMEVAINQAYWVATTEVTRGLFKAFATDQKHRQSDDDCKWEFPDYVQTDDHPVVCVSWHDAQAFIKWLNQQATKPKGKFRLLTESEWELAARGNDPKAQAWSRYWGEGSACAHAKVTASHFKCSYPQESNFPNTAPVGRFTPNSFGLFDMLGNAGEWTGDCHAPFTNSSAPPVETHNCSRVIRGGDWRTTASFVRAAVREHLPPQLRTYTIGFRLARND